VNDPWDMQKEALGAFIRSTRKNANLSLRQLAEMTRLSNPYLACISRPSASSGSSRMRSTFPRKRC